MPNSSHLYHCRHFRPTYLPTYLPQVLLPIRPSHMTLSLSVAAKGLRRELREGTGKPVSKSLKEGLSIACLNEGVREMIEFWYRTYPARIHRDLT
ncbi:unnamed protein product [Protopolystoma xenopodis]|uniref:Uncharacterized protein n=1 Tax=Protopolystoma xenopodis TaxID=117903 RepID=A0A448XT66_9PLAT|nr:unnamed protein product [Protopolystoma xenopodis]